MGGDGMLRKVKRVNQGDLSAIKTAFIPDPRGEEPGLRSQSVHKSVELS